MGYYKGKRSKNTEEMEPGNANFNPDSSVTNRNNNDPYQTPTTSASVSLNRHQPLSPPPLSPQAPTSGGSGGHNYKNMNALTTTAGYQYALREYDNTLPPSGGSTRPPSPSSQQTTSGMRSPSWTSLNQPVTLNRNVARSGNSNAATAIGSLQNDDTTVPIHHQSSGSSTTSGRPSGGSRLHSRVYSQSPNSSNSPLRSSPYYQHSQQQHQLRSNAQNSYPPRQHGGLLRSSSTMDDYSQSSQDSHPNSPSSSYSFPNYPGSPSSYNRHHAMHEYNNTSTNNYENEPEMVDTTYAEHYGDLYTGKPIRYIYPQGYGAMRPRSRPWQIALVSCGVCAWLNVFIVGHCSDRFDWEAYTYYNDDQYKNQNFDDDAMKIETRWCGSRPLYMMWFCSVIVTGLSCAYCSVIGYVKARDFAIANNRSQPPGMTGKSDYYVQLEEEYCVDGNRRFSKKDGGYTSYQGDDAGGAQESTLKKTIYQADGTPRFFGGQIYRPTQAAVSLTSR